ncbi:MAG: hypothetical protein CUN52_13255 [Phototrophicales bacterium]|nr:MAG: hypothetical protein CUN52_13255 [Phototrophicales bacterium]
MKLWMMIISMLILVGCQPKTPGKAASSFLPTLPDYNMTDAINVVRETNVLDRFGEFITGQQVPNVVTDLADRIFLRQLGLVQNYIECIMGKIDAFAIRFYSHKTLRNSVGAVLSVNWDRFANLSNQLGCLIPSPFFSDAEADPGLRPCADAWAYTENNVRYYFIYVGTSVKICQDLAEKLPRNR